MENEIWKDLKYRGINFGDSFEISNFGRVRNKNTNKILTMRLENRVDYTSIWFVDKAYRVRIGDAQEESGLVRTVFDREGETKAANTKDIFSRRETIKLGEMIEDKVFGILRTLGLVEK